MIFTESQKKAIHHCRPNNIIAFTFTEKAAAELKGQIISRCREELGEVHGMAEMYVGTMHTYCLDPLTAEVPKYLKFDVLNEVQQALFIDRHSHKSGLTASTDLAGQPLKRYRDTSHYLSAISILREADTDKAVMKNCSILAGLDSYRSLLDDTRHLDYSAIIEAAVEVLTCDVPLKQHCRARQACDCRRVSGPEPHSGSNRLAVARTRGQSLRRRRPRSNHLPIARQQRPGHSHLREALP
jgi:DNA helicase II / ATP-dependent DNA helicase PcrA